MSWVLVDVKSKYSHWFRKCNWKWGHWFSYKFFCLKLWADYCILILTLIRSWWSQWGVMAASPLACMMEVMVCYFVSDAHKITTTLVLVVFVGTYIMVSFKVLLQSILCSLIHMGGFFWGYFWRFFNHEYGDFLILIRVISFFWLWFGFVCLLQWRSTLAPYGCEHGSYWFMFGPSLPRFSQQSLPDLGNVFHFVVFSWSCQF
jgi:hypothetical protein